MSSSCVFLTTQYTLPWTRALWGWCLGEGKNVAAVTTGNAVWLRSSMLGSVNYKGPGASWCARVELKPILSESKRTRWVRWTPIDFPYSPFSAGPLETTVTDARTAHRHDVVPGVVALCAHWRPQPTFAVGTECWPHVQWSLTTWVSLHTFLSQTVKVDSSNMGNNCVWQVRTFWYLRVTQQLFCFNWSFEKNFFKYLWCIYLF